MEGAFRGLSWVSTAMVLEALSVRGPYPAPTLSTSPALGSAKALTPTSPLDGVPGQQEPGLVPGPCWLGT